MDALISLENVNFVPQMILLQQEFLFLFYSQFNNRKKGYGSINPYIPNLSIKKKKKKRMPPKYIFLVLTLFNIPLSIRLIEREYEWFSILTSPFSLRSQVNFIR